MKTITIAILFSHIYFIKNSVFAQDSFSDIDILEIRFEYHHSLLKDGYKLVRLFRSSDSCYFEVIDSRPTKDSAWFMLKPNKTGNISCSDFDSVLTSFNNIERREILDHNKNVVLMDGYRFSLTLTNLNSEITYSLHTPHRKDEGIENFKRTVNLILELSGTTWKKLVR